MGPVRTFGPDNSSTVTDNARIHLGGSLRNGRVVQTWMDGVVTVRFSDDMMEYMEGDIKVA